MSMVLSVILLVVGFVLLVKGADFFVSGSSSIAKKFSVPIFIIGMTIVAMGTSAPECAVSITASVKGSNAMAISNVIGSNIFNLLVVCGACSLFSPLVIKKATLKREFPFSIIVAVVLFILGVLGMETGHIDGVILLAIFAVFLYWMIHNAQKARKNGEELEAEEIEELSMPRSLIYIGGGLAAIIIGGQLVVNAAEDICLALGLSETLVGLTVCSIGTSLPELVTSIVAARKNQAAMALGNVIGSNIFNILLVGGLAAAISPIDVTRDNLVDMAFLVIISVYMMLLVWRKQKLTRVGGITLLALYAAYMVFICVRP